MAEGLPMHYLKPKKGLANGGLAVRTQAISNPQCGKEHTLVGFGVTFFLGVHRAFTLEQEVVQLLLAVPPELKGNHKQSCA